MQVQTEYLRQYRERVEVESRRWASQMVLFLAQELRIQELVEQVVLLA